MAMYCAVCNKKINRLFTGIVQLKDGVICTPCYTAAGYNLWDINLTASWSNKTIEDWKNAGRKEYRIKCNVCGKLFCFTDKDLHDNRVNAGKALMSAIGGVSSAVGGNQRDTFEHNKAVDRAADKVIDYNKCPECGSGDLVSLSKEEFDAEIAKKETQNVVAVSPADELKKYKELLDSGVITQEEFDAKKKQLLGL